MAQEWILSNFREYYDTWDEVRKDTFQNTSWKRYRLTLERYAKYPPPLLLNLDPVNYTGSPAEVEVNAVGQTVNLLGLVTVIGEYPDVTLNDRTLQYSINEPGFLLVSESWDGRGLVQYYDQEEGWLDATDVTGYGGGDV